MSGAIDTKLIAFYLPQFHPIPENSRWWGPGFTEWTNVTRAKPLFPGHQQPRLPRDLGFYDLRLPETREAQVRLAREHGIYGFCYYTYWLHNGKRLLEGPMEALLTDGAPDFPYCICWANESWTRSWDGGAADVLVDQSHDDATNAAFFEGMVPHFRDPRYIRVEGRPLLLIYRATLVPDIPAMLGQWRELAQRHGLAMPYMVAVEFFDVNAELIIARGFDAVCEFPPIISGADQSVVAVAATGISPEFHGRLLDYELLATWFERRPDPAYRRFKGVTLGWDNTARRGAQATVCVNFSIERYRNWLSSAIAQTVRNAPAGQRLVFINAWNEWAEGTYLEPDLQNGLGYLEATRDALLGSNVPEIHAAARPLPGALPAATVVSSCATPWQPASLLKLVGITCAGNEADIVEAFIRHSATLLDHLIILEHNTLDGTREILNQLVAEGLPITVEHSSERRFLQSAFTNQLLRVALETHGADWVFPLDCDEFLVVPTRANLDAALLRAGDAHGRLKWINYVPSQGDDAAESNPVRRIRHRYDYRTPSVDENPWVWKIAVNARFLGDYYLDRYELCQGNHFLALPGQRRPIDAPMLPLEDVALAHFPVRSAEQLGIKTALGVLNRLGSRESSAHYGKNWQEITSGGIGFETLAKVTRNFLDTGRRTAEALKDTPVKFAPLPINAPLAYSGHGLPTIALILKWIELNMLDDVQRRDLIFREGGTAS
jgi:Glycosyltransferase WbsX/Glycosyl transferase family 2